MGILIAAVVLLLLLVVVLTVIKKNTIEEAEEEQKEIDPSCCGAHEVCERDLETFLTNDTLYYQDEELDRFSEKNNNLYEEDDIDQFREVLYTLKRNEISSWLSSLEFRKIPAPGIIRDEAMLLLQD